MEVPAGAMAGTFNSLLSAINSHDISAENGSEAFGQMLV
jgi:hypothetical protein